MIWVAVFALIVSFGLNVLLSVLLSRRASQSMLLLDKAHGRTTEYTSSLVDRLMANDWITYKAYEEVPQDEPEPTEQEMVAVRGPDRGGFGSRLGLVAYRPPEEELEAMNEELP